MTKAPHCDTVDCKHYHDNGNGRPVRVCTPRDPCPVLALPTPARKWCYFDDGRGRPVLAGAEWMTTAEACQAVSDAGRMPSIKSENEHECTILCL
jgi:hypothetical protein